MGSADIVNNSEGTDSSTAEPVAIIGMALRVPGANTLEQFWSNIFTGKDCLYRATRGELEEMGIALESLHDGSFVAAKPRLEDIEYFDAGLFGIPKSQAELIDPAQRMFLECAWEAIEQAGIVTERDHNIGVFAGVEGNYLDENLSSPHVLTQADALPGILGNSIDYLTLRVSYELGLVGPSFTVMATCATSLLAVHLAVQNLRLGECSSAIAGGAKIDLPQTPGYGAGVDGMSSTSGRIKPFDIGADGTIFGDGGAVVVLRLLKDAIKDGNPIHGVIRGTGFCNDGRPEVKNSFIAPTVSGQKRAMTHAIDEAGIDSRTIGYVECHGTGTKLGDPIEVLSLTEVFRRHTDDNEFCAIGSVKGNVGHLGTAAGAVSLIKTCLALKHRVLPPLANFKQPNPKIDFSNSPFFVSTNPGEWLTDGNPRRAGVSAFGFGGANAHLIVEEFVSDIENEVPQTDMPTNGRYLLTVSAKSTLALKRRLEDLAVYLEQHPQTRLADFSCTLQQGRKAMEFRSCAVVEDQQVVSAVDTLRNLKAPVEPRDVSRPVVFLFPGQGSQTPGMGQVLYQNEPLYHEIVDYCADFLLTELGFDLRDKIHARSN